MHDGAPATGASLFRLSPSPGIAVPRYPSFLVLPLLLACEGAEPPSLDDARWLDLTHDFSAEAIYWPTAKPFEMEVVSAQRTPAGFYYAANNFSAAEHGGTHLDAPVHFSEGQWTTEQIPLSRLVGPAVVVDVSSRAAADRDYRVTADDLRAWEAAHGKMPEGAIVLVTTGWGKFWPDRVRYLGTDKTGPAGAAELHFPGIDTSAARWLVSGRKPRAVGIDTPSLDYGPSTTFDSHQILFAANIPGFENVAHLDQLPATGSWIIALPMKIRGGSGGPLRIVAALPECEADCPAQAAR
jgi:kynurenine formamidase